MRNLIFLFAIQLGCCFGTLLQAQPNQDTALVDLSDMSFDSDWEKQLFTDFSKGKPDQLGFFLAPRGKVSLQRREAIENRLQKELTYLRSKKIDQKSPAKKVKMVYNHVHETLLTRYEENTLFYKVFENGVYNCVSSTALMGWFFTKLNIPFSIRERPTHVYLIAYPNQEPIPLETTSAELGYFKFNLRFKTFYVRFLNSSGVITDEEMEDVDIDYLFARYYFADVDIDLGQLTAIQYSNDAIYNLEKGKHLRALTQFEKSYYLNPNDRSLLSIISCVAHLLDGNELNSQEDLELVLRAEKLIPFGLKKEYLEQLFAEKADKETKKPGETPQLDSAYFFFAEYLQDTALAKRFGFIYYYTKSMQSGLQSKMKQALSYAEKALYFEPENLQVQGLYMHALATNMSLGPDLNQMVHYFDSIGAQYPSLAENTSFIGLKLHMVLGLSAEFYQQSNLKKAESYRQQFEEGAAAYPELDFIPDVIGDAYGHAVAYYFRRGNRSAARKACNQGLKYAPNHYQLKRRQKALQ